MNDTSRLSTARHAPFLRCSGRCQPGQCPVLDSDATRKGAPTSPWVRRALAGQLPAKATS